MDHFTKKQLNRVAKHNSKSDVESVSKLWNNNDHDNLNFDAMISQP